MLEWVINFDRWQMRMAGKDLPSRRQSQGHMCYSDPDIPRAVPSLFHGSGPCKGHGLP